MLRDGLEAALLDPSATSFLDTGVPEGAHTYQLLARSDGSEDGPTCDVSVFVIPTGTKVSVDLGEDDVEDGLANSFRDDGGDGECESVICGPETDLREARSNWGEEDPTPDYPDAFFYFTVTDPAMKSQASLRIAATVYDDPLIAGAAISLQYTRQASEGPEDIEDTFYPQDDSYVRFLSGTGQWVVLEWPIEDAGFRSFQQREVDFRLGAAGQRLCIDRVEVTFTGEGPVDERPAFHRGDANADDSIDISDGIFILNFLFRLGETPPCREAANPNDDEEIEIGDAVYILTWLFLPGPAPLLPGPTGEPCGRDPSPPGSDLGCESYPPCE